MNRPFPIATFALLVIGCSPAAGASEPITGTSRTLVVRGSYQPILLDRVDRLTLEGGRLVIHGSLSTVTVDLPRAADATRLNRHWALITESNTERSRMLTFTHDESLDDFTIELPPSEAPIRYGGFSGPDGTDLLVIAWGEDSRSYRAELTIGRAPGAAGSPLR
jgi:hypothetical protein